MDFQESSQARAFRAEVAAFVAERLPPDIRAKVLGFRFRLEDDFLYKLPGGDKPIPVPAPSMELC